MDKAKCQRRPCRDDLNKARALNSELSAKVATLSNNKQYRSEFIAQEVGKWREEYQVRLAEYLVQEQTYARFGSLRDQAEYWTPAQFLARAVAVPDPLLEMGDAGGNTVKLLKAQVSLQRVTNFLLSLPRMTLQSLTAVADTALANRDWAALSSAYSEICYRAATDEEARALQYRFDEAEMSDVVEAKNLLAEAAKLEEYLRYTMQSIASGEEDMGVRVESYAATAKDLEQARQQAHAEAELDRERAVVNWQMGRDFKPAA